MSDGSRAYLGHAQRSSWNVQALQLETDQYVITSSINHTRTHLLDRLRQCCGRLVFNKAISNVPNKCSSFDNVGAVAKSLDCKPQLEASEACCGKQLIELCAVINISTRYTWRPDETLLKSSKVICGGNDANLAVDLSCRGSAVQV